MREHEPSDADAVPEGGPAPDAETIEHAPGVESQFLLARAQQRLLGAPADAAPVVVGRYRIVRRLGAGAMGLVYAGRDDALDREVAIKLLQSQLADSETSRQRLMREAQAMARLNHPNVAHVYEVGEHAQQLFIAMELVRGETLRQWQRERPRSVPELLAMHLQAARGLAAAHDVGLVHRDYKPDNVMIDAGGRARVMDFGLARASGEASPSLEQLPSDGEPSASQEAMARSPFFADATVTGTVMGTPAYMAPEQMAGQRVDHRADQFAFCVALYEALYGERPFSGATATARIDAIRGRERQPPERPRREVPRSVHALLRRGLAYAPADRFASMHALIDGLAPHVARAERRTVTRWLAAAGTIGAAGLTIALLAREPPVSAAAQAPVALPSEVDPWAPIVAASELPATMPAPLPDDPTHVTSHRLRNGLTIHLAPRPGVPLVETAVVVRVDATDERADEAGVSELLRDTLGDSELLGSIDPAAEATVRAQEHAVLAAITPQMTEAERDAKLAEAHRIRQRARPWIVDLEDYTLGAELGFGTIANELPPGSAVSQGIPRPHLRAWVQMQAERLRRPAFRRFLGQLGHDLNARRVGADDALRVAIDRAIGDETGWPLAADVVANALAKIPFAQMVDLHRRYYRPNNTAFVLVGDVTATEVMPLFEEAFGDWEPAELPPRRIPANEPDARVHVIDDGPAQVSFAWPATLAPEITAPLLVMLQRSTLAEQWLAADGRARWVPQDATPYTLELAVTPTPGHDLDDAEAAVLAMLTAWAEQGPDPTAWASAHRQQRREGLTSISSSRGLATAIADAFARRRSWQDHLASLRGEGMSPAAIPVAARTLLDHPAVVVRREPGPPTAKPLPSLELASNASGAPGPSALAQALRSAPSSVLEPQFLAPGRDALVQPWGEGRVIAVDEDVPVFRLAWVLPTGVADDPWSCDAWRARVNELAPRGERDGAAMQLRCGARELEIELLLAAEDLPAAWASIAALGSGELGTSAAARALDDARGARERLRSSAESMAEAFPIAAWFGDDGVDAHLPDDAALTRATPELLQASLRRTRAAAPDLLLAGPDARARVGDLPPPPGGHTRAPVLPRPRADGRTVVLLLDAPALGRTRVDVGVVLPVGDGHARARDEVLRFVGSDREMPELREPASYTSMPLADGLYGAALWTLDGADCQSVDAAVVLADLVARLSNPMDDEIFMGARGLAEGVLRAQRRTGLDAARYLWSWAGIGLDHDPALEQWTALANLSAAELRARRAEFATVPKVLTVSGDLSRLDRAALSRLGTVIEVDASTLRDPTLSDLARFGYALRSD